MTNQQDYTQHPITPAAQAVLDAAVKAQYGSCYTQFGGIAAAALRAVADQTLPAASPRDRATWSPFAGQIREEILSIAAELEGASTGLKEQALA